MAPWLAAGVRLAGHTFETPDDTNSWTIETPETEIVGNSKHLQIPVVPIPTRDLAEGCWPGDGAHAGGAHGGSGDEVFPGQARHLPPSMPAAGRGRLNRDRGLRDRLTRRGRVRQPVATSVAAASSREA